MGFGDFEISIYRCGDIEMSIFRYLDISRYGNGLLRYARNDEGMGRRVKI